MIDIENHFWNNSDKIKPNDCREVLLYSEFGNFYIGYWDSNLEEWYSQGSEVKHIDYWKELYPPKFETVIHQTKVCD